MHNKNYAKGRGVFPRGTTLVLETKNVLRDASVSLIDSTLLGFIDYPMITEEAELALMHKPPRLAATWAHASLYSKGPKLKML